MTLTNGSEMNDRLNILFEKQLNGTLSKEERIELLGLFLQPSLQLQLQQLVESAWFKTGETEDMSEEKKLSMFHRIVQADAAASIEDGPDETTLAPVIAIQSPRSRVAWKKWLAAASVLLLTGLGGYYWLVNRGNVQPDKPVVKIAEIEAPKTNKAVITLSDGRVVTLDSLTALAQNGVVVIKNEKGEIVYNGSPTNGQEISYNTLVNPRGSQVARMTLADGSKVWLNAGSSLRYPVVFTGNERKVEVSGEAYFEVAHDETKPFFVSKAGVQVQVLGTHFNVNAYDDEDAIWVTLLEGSVEVSLQAHGQNEKVKIQPGQQAVVNTSTIQLANPNLEEVVAWKNGYFHFVRADIPSVMRQLARWYDLEIAYEGAIPKREFGGEMQRDLPLSSVLRLLEKGNIRLRAEGKKLTVLP